MRANAFARSAPRARALMSKDRCSATAPCLTRQARKVQ